VDLRERLDDYEVTAVPSGRTSLALVWSEPEPEPGEVAEQEGPTFGVLALLDDYRITRIPGRVAS
jgi:hypothetical protein